MDKEILDKAIEDYKNEFREVLQTIIDAHNHGQKQKLLKNDSIRASCDRYGVKY